MAVDSVSSNLAPQISGAIRKAARSTGISFEYLLTTAKIESNLNPKAQASTSSANGLYQFISQTWLGTVKQEGAALGLGQYADAITKSSNGHYEVADPAMRTAIMKLRSDPATSAMMAGAFSRQNAFQLTGTIGRRPTDGELYTAHFLGPDGAGRLINAVESRPNASAVAMFPSAAAANRSIFYDRAGNSRSVSQVYDRLTGHFDKVRTATVGSANRVAEATAVAVTTVASAPIAKPPVAKTPVATLPVAKTADTSVTRVAEVVAPPAAVAPRAAIAPAPATAGVVAWTEPVGPPVSAPRPAAVERSAVAMTVAMAVTALPPETTSVARALADTDDDRPPVPDTKPLFQAMFTDRANRPVTTTVAGLWTPSAGSADAPGAAAAANEPTRTFSLFTDGVTNIRGLFHGKA